MVKSKETGRFYATAKRASISSTFDENTCKSLIGTTFPGSIGKEECDEYEYTIPDTGEIINMPTKVKSFHYWKLFLCL